MKRIGVLFGQERTFPHALIARINELDADVVAEPVEVGGVDLEAPRRYDLVLDRISQDVPFYRSVLKKWVADGTVVVNNPFWWSADDKFFNNVLARALGVAVPKTVLLPSHDHPPDTTSESFSNLEYPIDWDAIFAHVGFPAFFKPYSGGGWKSVYRVTTPDEFFGAYRHSARDVMTLQEEIAFEIYYRCYVIGGQHVRVMPYDPRRPFHERYVRDPIWNDPQLVGRVEEHCRTLARALGYDFDTMEFAVREGTPYAIDFLNPAPDADPRSVGDENFAWVLETAARWLADRVTQGPDPVGDLHWSRFLAGGVSPSGDGAGVRPRATAPLPSVGLGRRMG
jgi:hypothetical protein